MKFNKIQYVELIAQPGQTQIQFTPQTYLANKHTMSLETFSVNDVTKSISNYPVASNAQLKDAYLTLYSNDVNLQLDVNKNGQGFGQWIRNIPLWTLHRLSNGTDPYEKHIFEMMGQIITWEQSFVTLTDATAITTATAFVFAVGYN